MARPKDRKDFPNCSGCPYVGRGPWAICAPCAAEQLVSITDPCPICAQERSGRSCRNRLCTGQAGKIHIAGIEAVTLHTDPLNTVMARYKYHGKTGWATIFARLLVGHLEANWASRPLDLVVANPPNPGRHHTTSVLRRAALADAAGKWPFDSAADPAIAKKKETPRSAGESFDGKQSAAKQHVDALVCCHRDRIDGRHIIVYDDICTTGLQLNEVARSLRKWGAASVHGVVLGRQPWSY